VATQNRLLLDNGMVNTHYRGNRYTDYNRQTVQVCVLFAVCPGHKRACNSFTGVSRTEEFEFEREEIKIQNSRDYRQDFILCVIVTVIFTVLN
jgi:hypothetical protein